MPGKAPIERDANHVFAAGAVRLGRAVGGASYLLLGNAAQVQSTTRNVGEGGTCRGCSTLLEEVLPDTVVGGRDIKCRRHRIPQPREQGMA